jgi:multiple antibiotic resistance protein
MNIFSNFFHLLSYTFMAIFPVTNPIGMAPIFLSLTRQFSQEKRRAMAIRVAIYSFFVYWIILIAGSWVLGFFGLSIPIIKIAGGAILFAAAFNMLTSKPKITPEEQEETLKKTGDITFFPLTMPITTGAGSMAIAMAIGAEIVGKGQLSLATIGQLLGATAGIFLLSISILICYYFSNYIFTKLGKTGTDVVTQLSAFILLAVSVEVIWEGIFTLISALH